MQRRLRQHDVDAVVLVDELGHAHVIVITQHRAVGLSLKKLSTHHQVIAITHLPQIAGMADHHFAVEKIEQNKRTQTQLRLLEEEDRVIEVAKLLSGSTVTEAGLKNARELMGKKR